MADLDKNKIFKNLPDGFKAVVMQEETVALATRIAENAIQANTSIKNREIWLRVFKDGREGLATGASVKKEKSNDLMNKAISAWEKSNNESPVLPAESAKLPFKATNDKAVNSEDPVKRAVDLAHAVKLAEKNNLVLTGSFTSKTIDRELVSTEGADFRSSSTMADASCTLTASDGGSGWARNFGTCLSHIDLPDMVRTAGGKALNSQRTEPLKPGKYTVILEPAAVGSMLLFLGFLSFGGRVFNRGTSFLAGKIGKKVMPEHFNIFDDASDPRAFGWPFDYEGTPTRKIKIIENGIARGVAHDMTTAAQAGTKSTGHALAPGNGFGPYPKCVHMAGGKLALNEMMKKVDRSILITRLWYINYANPMRTMITGTTRDGTFLMERGRVLRAVSNMRFVESILEAFNRSVFLSRETRYVRQFGSTLVVPWMVIPDFTFTETI